MSEPRSRMPSCPIPIRLTLFLGVLIRLVFLAAKTLQIDEGWTILVATDSASVWDNTTFETAYDSHPILFYYLYRALAPLISFSDWAARIPVALFSIASLLLCLPLLRKIRMPTEICSWSLLLFAVLPVNTFYANDARVYSLVQLVGIVVFWFYLDHHKTSSRRSFIALTVSVAFSCMFDVIGCAPVIAIFFDNFFRHEETYDTHGRKTNAGMAIVGGAILSLPYAYFRYCQHQLVGASDQQFVAFTPNSVLDNLMQLTPFGIGRWHAESLPFGLLIYAGIVALVLGMMLSGLYYGIRRRDAGQRLCWFLLLPPFAGQFILIALLGGSPLYRRYLIGVVIALVPILVAGMLSAISMIQDRIDQSKRLNSIATLACLGLFFVVPLVVSCAMGMTLGDRPDWRALYLQIGPEMHESDGVLHTYASPAPRFVTSPLLAYARMIDQRTFPAQQFLEPRINLDHLDETISTSDAEDWATPEDQAATRKFVESFAGKRVWSFKTPMTLNRPIDLSELGNPIRTWKVEGLEATLYEIQPRDTHSTSQNTGEEAALAVPTEPSL